MCQGLLGKPCNRQSWYMYAPTRVATRTAATGAHADGRTPESEKRAPLHCNYRGDACACKCAQRKSAQYNRTSLRRDEAAPPRPRASRLVRRARQAAAHPITRRRARRGCSTCSRSCRARCALCRPLDPCTGCSRWCGPEGGRVCALAPCSPQWNSRPSAQACASAHHRCSGNV